jgi:peptidoglycan/LPS O-acetylase OafA/YrhL
MRKHFQQIDILKGLAILAVLLLHSLTREQLMDSYAVFHIWQAVPVFMVVMGVNLGLSYGSKSLHFGQLYSAHYFSKKAARIVLPLLVMYIVALVAGYTWQQLFDRDVYTLGWKNLIGVLPVSGKGNYFITLLLQSLLLLPLIGYSFNRWPVATSVLLVMLEIVFQLLATQVSYFENDSYLYDAAFFRYLSAIVLGLWLARMMEKPLLRYGWPLLVLGLGSGVYLYLLQYQQLTLLPFREAWQSQVLLTFPYAALLVYLCIKTFPQQSGFVVWRVLAYVGQASYHIFLAQVLYFGLVQDDTQIMLNLTICLLAGLAFYEFEKRLNKHIAP